MQPVKKTRVVIPTPKGFTGALYNSEAGFRKIVKQVTIPAHISVRSLSNFYDVHHKEPGFSGSLRAVKRISSQPFLKATCVTFSSFELETP
jgi:hypothetical protein